MGELMRRYWVPILLADQVPEPDCPPVRVRVLGERLIAFRASDGRVGLIAEHCPHRGASLFFGRNEEHGLRCVYHGWKYDVTGQCVEMPSEPPGSTFKERIRANAYPGVDRGGVIWAYLGPSSLQPPPPELEWTIMPDAHRFMTRRRQECNWLQALEGGFDPSHLAFLHRGMAALPGAGAQRLEIVPTEFGLSIGHGRALGNDRTAWRVNQLVMPCFKMITPRQQDGPVGFHAWVPIDDESCMVYSIDWHPDRPLTPAEVAHNRSWHDIHAETIPGTDRTVRNQENDYLIDRDLQRSGRSYTGIKGLAMQDSGIQESQGPIHDRSREHLAASDLAIVLIRNYLMEIVNAVQAGGEPPGTAPATHRVRAVGLTLPTGVALKDAPREVSRHGVLR
jgi:nitrite reductase/ring-hydroxylating ferredoxin subunit